MTWMLWYLAIGVATLVVIYVSHRLDTGFGPDCTNELLDASDPERRTWKGRLLIHVVAPLLAGLSVVTLWPIAIGLALKWKLTERAECASASKVFAVKRGDLLHELTVQEIEVRERVIDPLGAVPDVPFGHLNAVWRSFAKNLGPRDSLWAFSAQRIGESERRERNEGYVIVRDDNIGPHFLTGRKVLDQG